MISMCPMSVSFVDSGNCIAVAILAQGAVANSGVPGATAVSAVLSRVARLTQPWHPQKDLLHRERSAMRHFDLSRAPHARSRMGNIRCDQYAKTGLLSLTRGGVVVVREAQTVAGTALNAPGPLRQGVALVGGSRRSGLAYI
jgi:hypothetical protein